MEALNGEVAEIRDKREELQERMEKETEASKIHNLQKRIGDLSTDKEKPPANWAVDIFLDLEVPHEALLPVACP